MVDYNLTKVQLLTGETIQPAKWEEIFLSIFKGRTDRDYPKAILLLLGKKGENENDLWGCLRAVRQLERTKSISLPALIDVCGTGGDGMKTFNVSTVSSFVIAGAGAYVIKHGNRAVSSASGSSDLMEALGVRLEIPYQRMLRSLQKHHLAYFHAPLYHPSFSSVQGVRRELGVRTLFNFLGPLVNPVNPTYQMIGVSDKRWSRPVAVALQRLGRKRAAVVRSKDGLDELSTSGSNDILYLESGKIKEIELDPKRYGFSRARKGEFLGGDAKTNRQIALSLLCGKLHGPKEDIVLFNSGFALWLCDISSTIEEGIDRARLALRSGQALRVLEGLREL